jgi:hypothetical protein
MSVTPTIDYTKKLTAACACGRPATIAGQCNGCHEIGQYVKQIAPKPATLDEQLLQEYHEQQARGKAITDGIQQDIADIDALKERMVNRMDLFDFISRQFPVVQFRDEGSDNSMRGARADAGYGESGPF